MKHRHAPLIHIATLCLGALPALAFAHPGHGEEMSFVAGLLHPVGGVDHLAGFLIVGILVAKLRAQILRPVAAALLGLWIAACASDSEGWQYAAGFMFAGAGLVAIAVTATRLVKRAATATAPRSRT